MNAYELFKQFPENYYDWECFAEDLSVFLLGDKHLKTLIDRYPFLSDKFEDIEIDFREKLVEELIDFAWFNTGDRSTINIVYEDIVYIAINTFKTVMSQYIPSDGNLIRNDLDDISNLHSDDKRNVAEEYIGWLNGFDEVENELIKEADLEFDALELNRKVLINNIKQWRTKYRTIQPPSQLITKVPLIVSPNYFDPALYKLIQENPELLKTLDWRLFEEMLADILRSLKYTVELTKPTKDGGIDIVAIKQDANFGNHKYILQAKRYKDAVQVSPVRELLFLHREYGASKCCLATTSSFTRGAKELAEKYKWALELKDQRGILDWINQVIKSKNY